jgi:hypothetical protein
MTPADIIAWALALGIAWIVLALCIPIERWVGGYFATRNAALKSLEARMLALEQKSEDANHPPDSAGVQDQS